MFTFIRKNKSDMKEQCIYFTSVLQSKKQSFFFSFFSSYLTFQENIFIFINLSFVFVLRFTCFKAISNFVCSNINRKMRMVIWSSCK